MPVSSSRLKMGRAKVESVLLVDERAVGSDQDKRYVMVNADDRAAFRLVTLGQRSAASGSPTGFRQVNGCRQRSPARASRFAGQGAGGRDGRARRPRLASSD